MLENAWIWNKKIQRLWKCLKTDKVLESTWKSLKKLEFKSCKFWNFAFIIMVFVSTVQYTSVSHCSLNFECPCLGHGFLSIILVLEKNAIWVLEKCLNFVLWVCYEPCLVLLSTLLSDSRVLISLVIHGLWWTISGQVKAHVMLTCTNWVSPNHLPVIVASNRPWITLSTHAHYSNLQVDWNYSTKRMMMQSYGWNLQQLQQSRNK